MERVDCPVLMWVTDQARSDSPLPELAIEAAGSGLDLIQVREKHLSQLPLELLVRAVRQLSDPSTQVVVNSNLAVARKLGVGVHLPEQGPTIEEARMVLGADAPIGRSVHSPESAQGSTGATYLVAGHLFETGSKDGLPPIGIDRFAEIVRVAPAPVLAIGGVTPDRLAPLLAVGAAGVAVMSPFTQKATIAERVADYRKVLESPMPESSTATITATINGKPTELPAGTTISTFLAGRELHERLVVVERNGEIVNRSAFSEVVVEEGDLLEIVHFVGGGA